MEFICKFSLLSPVTLVTALPEFPPHLDLKSACNPFETKHIFFESFSCLISGSEPARPGAIKGRY